MMEEIGQTRWAPDEPQALKRDIVETVANAVNTVDTLKRNIQASLERQITPAAELASRVTAAACEPVAELLRSACDLERWITACVCEQIAGQLAAAQGVIDLCQGKISKAQKKLEKRAQRCTMPPADAQPQAPPNTAPQPPPAEGAAVNSAPAGRPPAGSLTSGPAPFPLPPQPGELDTLSIPTRDGVGYLPLRQLPAQFWSHESPDRVWFSLEPTPLTRGSIEVDKEIAGDRRPYGQIYLNVGLQLPPEAIKSLPDAFGVDPSRVSLLNAADAYNAAVGVFGPQVVDCLYDVYGLTVPVIRPTEVPPIKSPEARARIAELAREEAELNGHAPPPPATNGVHPVVAPPATNGVHQVVLPELPNLGQLFGQALPEFTAAKVCEWMTAILGPVGVNAADLPPCVSLEEAMRRFYARLLRRG